MRTRHNSGMVGSWVMCAVTGMSVTSLAATSDESAVFTLPAMAEPAPLIVELDGYDVTAVIHIEGSVLTVPTRGLALEAGEHPLRVLVSRANGDIDTLLETSLRVAGSRESTGTQTWDVLLGSAWRVAEHTGEDFAGAGRSQQRATLQWNAELDSQRWIAAGAANVLYDSVTTNSPDGSVWQAPGYLLQAGRKFSGGSAALALGDDSIALGNLLFGSYSRRGLSFSLNALDERVSFQAFTLNSEAETRLDAAVVPTGDTGSVQGGYAVAAPFPHHPEWLRITSGFVSGDTTLGGVATSSVDPVTRYGGQAWNTALDSWALGSALWLHAEYAQSSFDSDGLSAGTRSASDEATHFAAQLSAGGALTLPMLDSWAIGFEHQLIGPHFYSLGNLMVPGDLSLERAYLRAGTHGFDFSADETRHRTDVDDDPLRPRRLGATRAITASYTPPTADPSTGIWRVLGIPTVSAEWQDVAWRQRPEDAQLAGFDLDSRNRTRTWGLDLTRERTSISLRQSEIDFDDRSEALIVDDFEIYTPQPDTRESTFTLQFTWMASDRFSLSPQLQSTTLRDRTSGARSRNELWGLQAQAELKPERLWLQANYSETRDRPAPFDPLVPVDTMASGGGSASLVYRALAAGGYQPNLDLQLTGQYGSAFEHDTWQVMLGFTVNWNKESL
ncbi:MAG: hypothetical protein ABI821_06800 [Pseudomonadota bacterium]